MALVINLKRLFVFFFFASLYTLSIVMQKDVFCVNFQGEKCDGVDDSVV